MKRILTKILVASLLFSVAVSSVMQVTASEMVRGKNLKNIRDSARKGMPLTFKLGVDGEIASVNLHDNTNLASVFVLTENLSEDQPLLSYRFCDEDNVAEQLPLMEAIIAGHDKQKDRFGREFRSLITQIRGRLKIEIPEDLISAIATYFPGYWMHKQNRALIKQVKTIRKGKVDESRKTIEAGGIDLDKQDPDSLTSLEYAVYCCLPEIVALLLESKADPNMCCKRYSTLLCHALKYDTLEIAELLIRHNADIHYDSETTQLFGAVINNNLEAVKLLIESEADVSHVNEHGQVALDRANNSEMIELLKSYQAMELSAEAIIKGNVGELREAIESGVDPDKIINGATPLAYATYYCLSKVVDLLLDNDADPNLCNNYDGGSSLHTAVDRNNVEIAGRLIRGNADLTQEDWKGKTALSKATDLKNSKMIELLQSYEKIRSEIQANRMFLKTIREGDVDALRDTIESNSVNLNGQIAGGMTLLTYATCCRRPEVVELLLEKGANPNVFNAYDGNNALHTAVDCGDTTTVKLLIDREANVNQTNWYGATAFSKAKLFDDNEASEALSKAKLLGDNEASVTQTTALSKAKLLSNSPKMTALLKTAIVDSDG